MKKYSTGEKLAFARWVRVRGCTMGRMHGAICPGCVEDWERGWLR